MSWRAGRAACNPPGISIGRSVTARDHDDLDFATFGLLPNHSEHENSIILGLINVIFD